MIKRIESLVENKGITLITLIVTIVILIILATITVYTVLGENGIVAKANDAKQRQSNAQTSDNIKLNILDKIIEYATGNLEGEIVSSSFRILTNNVELVDRKGSIKIEVTNNNDYDITYKIYSNNTYYSFSSTDQTYEIPKNSKIELDIDIKLLYGNGLSYDSGEEKYIDDVEIIASSIEPYTKEDTQTFRVYSSDKPGTKDFPIGINSADDFIYYMNSKNNQYENIYFKQTTDLDLTDSYKGISDAYQFKGIYDGAGHTITVETDTDKGTTTAPFPRVDGVIMNLGIVGKITGSNVGSFTVGIYGKGTIINCWSTAEVEGNHRPGGVTCYTQEGGLIANVFYAGQLTGIKAHDHVGPLVAWPSRYSSNKSTYFNNYYQSGIDFTSANHGQATEMTEEEMKSQTLIDLLNNGREESVALVDASFNVTSEDLLTWTMGPEGYPVLLQN